MANRARMTLAALLLAACGTPSVAPQPTAEDFALVEIQLQG